MFGAVPLACPPSFHNGVMSLISSSTNSGACVYYMVNMYPLAEVTDLLFRTPVGVGINPKMRQMARGLLESDRDGVKARSETSGGERVAVDRKDELSPDFL